MLRGNRMLAVVLAVALVFALSAVSMAKDVIRAYTTLDEELARKVFNAFEEDTGIKVEWVRLSTGEAVARMDAERNNPQVSIWYGGVGLGHIEAKNKGLTTPYFSPKAANIPGNMKDKDGYWTGIYAGPLCFVSNTDRLKELGAEAPQSWEDLTKPVFKGHIEMANPGTSGTSYNVVATAVQIFGEDEAFKYLERLNTNISQYTRSGSAPGKHAAIGEIPVAIGYAHDQVRLKAEGYPLLITFPSEGTGYEVASVSLIKNGPETELAKKLLDWALSERAGEIYASVYVVPFVDVPLADGAVPISQVNTIDQDDEWAGANRDRLVQKWNDVIYSGN